MSSTKERRLAKSSNWAAVSSLCITFHRQKSNLLHRIVETYLAYPEDKSTEKAILILSDVLGHKFVNAQLIADQFATNGYFVAMPDLYNGDPCPMNPPQGFDWKKWLFNGHTVNEVDPIVEKVVAELKGNLGVKKLGAVGYCFGAKYVVRFLKSGQIDAGYVAHPSFVDESELEAIEGPLSIAAAG